MAQRKPENGICPIMTRPAAAPVSGDNLVKLPGGQNAAIVNVTVLSVPCPGEDCQLWDGYSNVCSLKSSPFLQYAIEGIGSRMPQVYTEGGKVNFQIEALIEKIADVFELFQTVYDRQTAVREHDRQLGPSKS